MSKLSRFGWSYGLTLTLAGVTALLAVLESHLWGVTFVGMLVLGYFGFRFRPNSATPGIRQLSKWYLILINGVLPWLLLLVLKLGLSFLHQSGYGSSNEDDGLWFLQLLGPAIAGYVAVLIQLYSFTLFYRVLKPGNIKKVWTVYFSLAVLSLVGGFLYWISELLLVWQIPTFILLILGFFGTIISVGSVVMPFVIVPIMTVTLLANRNWVVTVEMNPNESVMDRLIREIRREISGQIPLQWSDLVAFCNFSDGVTINYYFNDYGEPNRYFKGDTIATGYSAFESRTLSPVTEKVSELRQLLQKQDTKAISYLILSYRTEAELTVTHADWQATQFADDQIAAYYADKYLQNVPLRRILPALSEEVVKEMDRVGFEPETKTHDIGIPHFYNLEYEETSAPVRRERKITIDIDFRDPLLWFDRTMVDRWDAPHDHEVISDADKERIFEIIRDYLIEKFDASGKRLLLFKELENIQAVLAAKNQVEEAAKMTAILKEIDESTAEHSYEPALRRFISMVNLDELVDLDVSGITSLVEVSKLAEEIVNFGK